MEKGKISKRPRRVVYKVTNSLNPLSVTTHYCEYGLDCANCPCQSKCVYPVSVVTDTDADVVSVTVKVGRW